MDFHTLARRELQSLCKKNKIPANMTNVAMADALAALQHVEGLEEIMNPSGSDVLQSPARPVSASIPHTGCRTSARRKPIREVEVSQPLTQARRTRRTVTDKGEQENKDANVPKTPALPSSRRRTPAASACQKLDSQLKEVEEEEKVVSQEKTGVPETPTVMSSRGKAPPASASAQRVYSTRRSVKLLEMTMADLSLNEGGKAKAVNENSKVTDEVSIEENKDTRGMCLSKEEVATDLDVPVKESSGVLYALDEIEENKDTIGSDMQEVAKDLEELSKESSEVPDVLDEIEENHDTIGTDMQTPEKLGNFLVSDETQDKKPEVSENDEAIDEKGADEVLVTEFSSESDNIEETVTVFDEVSTVELSLPQEEVCENLVSKDSDIINIGEDDGHGEHGAEYVNEEEKDNGSMMSDEEAVPADDGRNALNEKQSEEAVPEDDGGKALNEKQSEKAYQTPFLPEVEIDFEFDFEMEDSGSKQISDGLFDVSVIEADGFIKNETPKCNQSLEQTSSPLVDVYVMQEAEFSPPTVKGTPFHSQLSGDQAIAKTSLPSADDAPLPYQFPRPVQSTARKSATKEQTTTQKMTLVLDDKENVDKNNKKADGNKDLESMSLRHLKKLLKELNITSNDGDNQTAKLQQPERKTRVALQTLPDNQMAAAEQEKN